MENQTQDNRGSKRRLVEIADETAKKMRLFCFVKDIRMNYFATKAIEKELQPYEAQLDNFRKLDLVTQINCVSDIFALELPQYL